ncbi:MAG: hypothetical protein AB7V16_14115 [Vulcanibacillus sp.]
MLRNKKAIGIPFVLGIVTFVLALVTTLFSVTVNQAKMITTSQKNTENYSKTLNEVNSVLNIIESNPSILSDTRYLELEKLFSVSITKNEISNYWIISGQISDINPTNLVSYLTESGSSVLYDLPGLFASSGTYTSSDPIPKLTISADDVLYTFYSQLLSDNNRNFIYSQNPGETMFNYILRDAKQQGNTGANFIDYRTSLSLSRNQTFQVATGKVLFVEGNLTMSTNSKFIGKAVIGGNWGTSVSNQKHNLKSTFFVGGNLYLGQVIFDNEDNYVTTGFVKGSINIRNSSGTGFLIAESLSIQIGSGSITGGFFISSDGIDTFSLGGSRQIIETSISDDELVFDSLPIITFSDNSSTGELQYTYPRLNTN